MRARKPRGLVARAIPAEMKLEIPTPTVVLSRRAGRFEVRETLQPGVEPADLDGPLDRLTKTGRVERRLARLDSYLRRLAAGGFMDEAFFGIGIFLDVPGHPWPRFCDVDQTGRPVGLKAAMSKQLTECVAAFGTVRPGRKARGKQSQPTRAEHFSRLAATLGHVDPRVDPADVRRMVRAGKRAIAAGK